MKIYHKKPKKVEFAFLCVLHDEINTFLKNHEGFLFDYKNIDFD